MEQVYQIQEKPNKLEFIPEKQHISEGLQLNDQEKEYLLPHFTMLLIGKPGSGKTSVIRQMMDNPMMYKDKFDKVLLISPSYAKMGLEFDQKDCHASLDLPWIHNKLDEINQEQLTKQRKAYDNLHGINTADVEQLDNNGQKIKSKLGKSSDVFEHLRDLVDRLYSGKSRFYGRTDRPQLGSIPQINPQLKRQGVKKLAGPVKIVEAQGNPMIISKQQQEQVDAFKQHNLKQLNELPIDVRQSFYQNTLLILDDVVSDIKKNETNPLLNKLIFNRRHLIHNGMVSIMLVSQKYTMIPARVRSNANWILTYKMNPVDQETMWKDVVHMSRDQWDQIVTYVFGDHQQDLTALAQNKIDIDTVMKNKKHDCLGIWVESDMYFKNFKMLIF